MVADLGVTTQAPRLHRVNMHADNVTCGSLGTVMRCIMTPVEKKTGHYMANHGFKSMAKYVLHAAGFQVDS